MSAEHFVQFGAMGLIGRFQSVDFRRYSRDSDVVCRTDRGLEIGRVLNSVDEGAATEFDGQILRPVASEDQLLIHRLRKNRDRAIEACNDFILSRGISTMVLDVEHLFDGKNIYFYFLGDVSPELEALTEELGEVYEAKSRFRKFAETLINGCGPGCGTEEKSCGSCSTCSMSGSCGKK